jgi:hypothetical protein
MREYHPVYADIVVETILGLPRRRQQKLLALCQKLADNPFTKSDYSIKDGDGRDIEHLLVEGFVIAYWMDHPVCKVMIVEVDDVR